MLIYHFSVYRGGIVSYQEKARELYEYHRESILDNVDKARLKLSELSTELEYINLSDEEYEKLDKIVIELMLILDEI